MARSPRISENRGGDDLKTREEKRKSGPLGRSTNRRRFTDVARSCPFLPLLLAPSFAPSSCPFRNLGNVSPRNTRPAPSLYGKRSKRCCGKIFLLSSSYFQLSPIRTESFRRMITGEPNRLESLIRIEVFERMGGSLTVERARFSGSFLLRLDTLSKEVDRAGFSTSCFRLTTRFLANNAVVFDRTT